LPRSVGLRVCSSACFTSFEQVNAPCVPARHGPFSHSAVAGLPPAYATDTPETSPRYSDRISAFVLLYHILKGSPHPDASHLDKGSPCASARRLSALGRSGYTRTLLNASMMSPTSRAL